MINNKQNSFSAKLDKNGKIEMPSLYYTCCMAALVFNLINNLKPSEVLTLKRIFWESQNGRENAAGWYRMSTLLYITLWNQDF